MTRHFIETDAAGVVFSQWTIHDAPQDFQAPPTCVEVTDHPQRTGDKALLFHTRKQDGNFEISAELEILTADLRRP